MKEAFRKISAKISNISGSAGMFIIALSIVVIWAMSGSYFEYSNTWQLVINTGTTIVTFLMVFLIQNTQNRDSKSIHLKLDELIRSSKGARDSFLGLDNLSDQELSMLDDEFKEALQKKGELAHMVKMRAKIEAEKQRRHLLKNAGVAVYEQLKKPIVKAKDFANSESGFGTTTKSTKK